jgi:protocatechuate 3,4-dioxygenase beta subunit
MDRKKFLISSSLTAIALTTFGCVVASSDGTFKGDCSTTNDILGPFYRPDAPNRSDLTYEGLAGARITLKGKVYQSDCTTPLKDALVEIWQCNTQGEYDNDSDDFNLRGSLSTNENGEYSFLTIIPGKYLNGRLYRPAHIHYRVTAQDHRELISQIYFKGDPHITEDPWASQEKAQLRILEITPEDLHGNLAINFDIYLGKA